MSGGDLVRKAKSSSRQELADACRKRRQEGVDREELATKQHALRSSGGSAAGLYDLARSPRKHEAAANDGGG